MAEVPYIWGVTTPGRLAGRLYCLASQGRSQALRHSHSVQVIPPGHICTREVSRQVVPPEPGHGAVALVRSHDGQVVPSGLGCHYGIIPPKYGRSGGTLASRRNRGRHVIPPGHDHAQEISGLVVPPGCDCRGGTVAPMRGHGGQVVPPGLGRGLGVLPPERNRNNNSRRRIRRDNSNSNKNNKNNSSTKTKITTDACLLLFLVPVPKPWHLPVIRIPNVRLLHIVRIHNTWLRRLLLLPLL